MIMYVYYFDPGNKCTCVQRGVKCDINRIGILLFIYLIYCFGYHVPGDCVRCRGDRFALFH